MPGAVVAVGAADAVRSLDDITDMLANLAHARRTGAG
jgi:hypothetical protein